MAKSQFKFGVGEWVKVGTGTTRFPVPQRYAGRMGLIAGRTRQGNTVVYDIDFGPRRVATLPVTQGHISA